MQMGKWLALVGECPKLKKIVMILQKSLKKKFKNLYQPSEIVLKLIVRNFHQQNCSRTMNLLRKN